MLCPNCGYDNREGAKFCNECAAPLSLRCPSCGTENRPGAKFCNECAASLTGEERGKHRKGETEKKPTTSSDARPQTLDARHEAERRQLTVMFCDLVGSTPLAEQLDPEELREVVRTYQETCATVIHRFDGYIARYIGDALLVYFGYPTAHEDDAQRAARVGLGIVEAIPVAEAA
jgi:class 3 adenylate cyclase